MKYSDIKQLLEKYNKDRGYCLKMRKRYTTESIPIKYEVNPAYVNADIEERCKPDRRLYNHFEKEIVDTKVSYFTGYPVKIMSYDNNEDLNLFVDSFNITSNYEDLMSELVKECSISGKGGVLLYKNEEAEVMATSIPGHEFKVFYNMKDPVSALRKYTDANDLDTIEYYDKDYLYVLKFINKEWVSYEPVLHGFGRVPLIELINNAENQSDYHSVVDLIDSYNRLITDFSNEVESFRLAYLILKNVNATKEDLAKLRETGALMLDKDGDAYFLTKDINTEAISTLKEILERNIVRFASHVDFTSEGFTGNLTKIAVAYKLRPLEQKSRTLELKFSAFLRELYRTLFSYKGLSVTYDYTDLVFKYTRNVPINILDSAEAAAKLKGLVSERTLLSTLDFIGNVDDELALIEEESGDNNNGNN